ncbi:MAG: hypothetical protein CVV22_12100 [Ignavibacteriae bacterium HGW-Ignavibacteriae-1]|jgi:hypothetical protein|nr:MAG: hypothetical protein CVV22_12100 [Ignavibacteriae bacterium HGW-Ignavibacteriae-1]
MKNAIYLIILLSFISNESFAQAVTPDRVKRSESNPDFHKQRREWLESMHRAEPGVDWKIIDREVREYRRNEINQLRQELGFKDPNLFLNTVAANGSVVGKWKERGSNNQSGRIHCCDIDFSRELIYAASSGGNVWRGTLDGEDWTCLNNSFKFNIRDLRILKVGDKNRIIVFDQRNVFYSDDEGLTWHKSNGLQNVESTGYISRGISVKVNSNQGAVEKDNSDILYLLANENISGQKTSIYYSTDSGESFDAFRTHVRQEAIDIWGSDSGDPNLYLFHRDSTFFINAVANGEKIKFQSLFPSYELLDNPRFYAKGAVSNGKTVVYLAIRLGNEAQRYVQKTTDGGKTWNDGGIVPTDMFMWNSFGVSKSNPDVLFMGGVNCFKSTNSGATWSLINEWYDYYNDPLNKLHADIPEIKSFMSPEGEEIILISTDGGLYRTYGDSDNIVNISLSKLNVSQYYSIYTYNTPNQIIYVGSQDQGFQRSEPFRDAVLDFEQTISGDYGSISSGDYGKSLWTVYPGFAMIFPDATKSNQRYTWNFPQSYGNRVWMPPIVAVPGYPNLAYIAPGGSGDFSTLWRLEFLPGGGISAGELPYKFDQNIGQNDVTAIGISELDIDYMYVVTRLGKFYNTTNRGGTWTETMGFTGPGYNYLHGTKVLPSRAHLGTIYIAGSGYSSSPIYVSRNNGISFEAMNNGMPPTMVYDLAASADEEVLFAATSSGPYIYIKNHNKWYHIGGLESPDQNYWSVNYLDDKKIARFATYGRGIWDFEISHLTTTSIEENQNISSNRLKVFPNPATDFVNVEFGTTLGKPTIIKLYDIAGNVIAILHDEIAGSEKLTLDINLQKISGSKINSGNYLLVATSGNSTEYFKLSIVR